MTESTVTFKKMHFVAIALTITIISGIFSIAAYAATANVQIGVNADEIVTLKENVKDLELRAARVDENVITIKEDVNEIKSDVKQLILIQNANN